MEIGIEDFNNLLELRQLNRTRHRFNRTVEFMYGEVGYIPPRKVSENYWKFSFDDFYVEGATEMECFQEMKNILKEKQKEMSSFVDWS